MQSKDKKIKLNNLSMVNPQLAEEWNYDKNGTLTPHMVTVKSGQKVWWKCSKGHEWQATIAHRSNGNGCPYCSGRNSISGSTDLATVNSTLASEWNYDKNGILTPQMVTAYSNQKVWWKCSKGHEWQAVINNRSNGRGCPYCRRRLEY